MQQFCFFSLNTKPTSQESSTISGQSYGDRENPLSIRNSSVSDHTVYLPHRGLEDDTGSADNLHSNDHNLTVAPRLTRSRVIQYAQEHYGVSEPWVMWLIGTTFNEDYFNDRYLQYAWACEILNCYTDWSVDELDCIWGSYYSISHAFSGYYIADEGTLEMVWLAMTERDTRIVEVDGMIDYPPSSYYLIYDSDVYNCQVWGE